MVLKDWKKIESKDSIIFKKGCDEEVRIVGMSVQILDFFGVSLKDLNKAVKIKKTFKTKPQALRFAKAYMKKH